MYNTETGIVSTQLIEVESDSERTIYAVKYHDKYIGEVTAWAGNAAFGVDWTTDETTSAPVLYGKDVSYATAREAVSVLIMRYESDVVMQVCAKPHPRVYVFKATATGRWCATRLGCGSMKLRRLAMTSSHAEALATALKFSQV